MEIAESEIVGVRIIRPRTFADSRGAFHETYSKRRYAEAGIEDEFVQDNHVLSRGKGTIRGLHFQTPPFVQAKLVWVVRGAVWDVVVDLRHGSPTFGRHQGIRLAAGGGEQIYVPQGLAHGYCTLEPDTEIVYKVSADYAPDHENGVLWNDPGLAIPWPVTGEEAIIAERDQNLPRLDELPQIFSFR